MEGLKKWLTENPLGRLVASRLVAAALGGLGATLLGLGLLAPEVAACLSKL